MILPEAIEFSASGLAGNAVMVTGISIDLGDLSERLALFRQRMNELPAEVVAFLGHLQRLEEALSQGF